MPPTKPFNKSTIFESKTGFVYYPAKLFIRLSRWITLICISNFARQISCYLVQHLRQPQNRNLYRYIQKNRRAGVFRAAGFKSLSEGKGHRSGDYFAKLFANAFMYIHIEPRWAQKTRRRYMCWASARRVCNKSRGAKLSLSCIYSVGAAPDWCKRARLRRPPARLHATEGPLATHKTGIIL